MARSMTRLARLLLTLLFGSLLLGGLRPTTAQQNAMDHPAHIHAGSCAQLGAIAYPLQDLALTSAATPTTGASSALPVVTSVTTVPVKLSDLLVAPYAINVHQSATEIGHYLACGDLGGTPVGGTLAIGLRLLGTDGYAGVATLQAAGAQTIVTLQLVVGRPAPPAPVATPVVAATPTGTTLVAVTLVDMQVQPAQTSFVVGQPYTFVLTNQGHAVHEFVIERRGDVDKPLKQGGREAEASNIAPGQTATLSWTFSEPGAYKFSCHLPGHYEAGMTINVDVTS